MRKSISLVALAVGLTSASAQNVSPGNYTGNMTYVGGGGKQRTDQVEIKIDKVEGSAVRGTVTRHVPGFCRGEVPVEGAFDGDKLTLRTVKGAAEVKEGCGFSWELKVDGQKLEGKSPSGASLQLSK